MMADSDEFHVVRRRRGKKSAGKLAYTTTISNSTPQTDDVDVFDLKNFQKRLNECMQELLSSEFFQISYDTIITALSELIESKTKQEHEQQTTKDNEGSCGYYGMNFSEETPHDADSMKTLNVPDISEKPRKVDNPSVDLLCYGIGKFSACVIARHQLAFLLLLKDKLGNPPCHVYDPMFSSHEKTALEELGCSLIESNEEGKRVCLVPTIAFLPHCGKALYNNLIWANLSSSGHKGIHNLLLIGNSFSSMIERTPERQLLKTANYVKKVYSLVQETALPLYSTHGDVFNDLALHTFPLVKSKSITAEFWSDNPKPVYDEKEVELIMKKDES